MRVGIVTTWAECGAGHVSLAHANALSSQGCDVAIYSRGQYLRDQRWGASSSRPWPVVQDDCNSGLTRVNPNQFGRWFRSFQPDWLLFNEQRSWAAVLQARAAGIRAAGYIDYYRSDTISLFKLYDLLLCHTHRHFEVFSSDPRAVMHPWCVDTDRFSPGSRQIHGPGPQSHLVIIHSAGMGGPSDRKGTDLALKGFSMTEGHAELIVHTQLPRDMWPSEWSDLMAADSRIRILEGHVDPVDLYRSGDLYLYPSRLEGIGLTLPEALSCGLSALTTDAQPMSEFVQDGINGNLIPVWQYRGRSDGYYWPESWLKAEAITTALQPYLDRPELARQRGREAREMILATRKWSDHADILFQSMSRFGIRSIDQMEMRRLSRLAGHQDRVLEPRALDHLFLAAAGLIREMRRDVVKA